MIKRITKILNTALATIMIPVTLLASEIKREIVVNIPAYRLTLIEKNGKISKEQNFDVAVGGLFQDRHPTPTGAGSIYEKRKKVLFFYGGDFPQLKIKKGDVIKWNNTFTPEGKPIGHKVPYGRMRGLGMKIKADSNGRTLIDYVVHSTLDEHTIGFAVSGGCLRIGMEDMLKLYDMAAPGIDDGKIDLPLTLKYDLVELNNGNVTIHANIYNKKMNYTEEFKNIARKQGIEDKFDYNKIEETFKKADESFKEAYKEVIKRSLKPFPGNYLPPELRARFHQTYKLSDLELKL